MKRNTPEEVFTSSNNFAEGLHFEFDFPTHKKGLIQYIPSHSPLKTSITTIISPENSAFQFNRGLKYPSLQKFSIFSLCTTFFALCLFSIIHLFEVDMNTIGSRLHSKKARVEQPTISKDMHAPLLKSKVATTPTMEAKVEVANVTLPEKKEIVDAPVKKMDQDLEKRVAKQKLVEKEESVKPLDSALEKTNKRQVAKFIPAKSKYEEGLARSLQEGRFTFLKFGATWCTPCKLMESSVFQYSEITDLLDQRFVTVDLDIDQPEGMRVKKKFAVEQVPTFILLDERGQELGRINGSTSTSKMLTFLEAVVPFMPEQQYITDLTADVAEK